MIKKYLEFIKESRESIDSICQKYSIENYIINDDGSIDVEGNVYLNDEKLTKLPLKFRQVGGDFYCDNNQLTNLEGAPQIVGGGFDCIYNQLTSLEGGPKNVGGHFSCDDNQLTSLEGGPSYVKGDFMCSDNPLLVRLTNDILDVGGNFYLSNTPLEVLWYDVLKGDNKFLDYLNTQTWDNVFPAPKTVYEDYFLEGVEENNIDIPDNWRELLEEDGWTII